MTDDSTTAAEYGADTAYGADASGDDYSTEVAPDEEQREDISWYKYEYYAWGGIHLALVVTGILINSWYNGLVTTSPWFVIQCPAVAYTTATGAVSPVSLY